VFDLINGLPVHPLVVHAVVVLLPLAVLGTIAIALRPAWRLPYGYFVVGAAAVATVLLPVSTSSGEALEERVGNPGEHAELGDQLIWFALPLLILLVALVVMEWRRAREDAAVTGTPVTRTGTTGTGTTGTSTTRATAASTGTTTASRGTGSTARTVVAGLAILAALATGVQVYRVGDSGARAAWGDRVASSSGAGD
jgi:uncharacterized membrane protein